MDDLLQIICYHLLEKTICWLLNRGKKKTTINTIKKGGQSGFLIEEAVE